MAPTETVDQADVPTPDQADVRTPETPEDARAFRDRLRAQLAALDAEDPPAGEEPPTPTHVLVLSNGERVEHAGTVSTRHSTKDGIFDVVASYALNGDR